jgi:hypothetical protein
MLWRSSRGRPLNAPAAFIHPCQPIIAKQPPAGPGWAHELKHDGYRLQIHVRDGRVKLYTINGADWSKRYPLIVRDVPRSRAQQLLMPKWFGSTPTACRTSRRCIAVPTTPERPPARLTFLCATVTSEGWSRDVTEDIARALLEQEARNSDLSESAKRFVERVLDIVGL